MFIVFEGLDGSGSSTQVDILFEHFSSQNIPVVQTKEPTVSPIGSLVRSYLQHKHTTSPWALQLLFASDRADHIHSKILPSIQDGKIVISDRYLFSSIAFGARSNEEYFTLKDLYKDTLLPDICFLLKVPPTECIKRIESRGSEKELFEKQEVLERVWANYERLSQEFPCIHIIDGMQSKEEVSKEIIEIFKEILPK